MLMLTSLAVVLEEISVRNRTTVEFAMMDEGVDHWKDELEAYKSICRVRFAEKKRPGEIG